MPQREIVVIQACLNTSVQAFKPTLDALAARHPNLKLHYRYSESAADAQGDNASFGQVSAELIERLVPGRDADYYFCGPKPFMVAVYHDLLKWGIPSAQVHFEFFGPKQELEQRA